ncbi:ribosome-associated heat shock protein Hsp15 [Paraglaciecola sp. L3A3]|uniref:ribosome-associated heat shock protein Hsp15 n=1 Tax=Paraglaciecola sp. L3A3 TaxID=2686358 RepID=UPI00131AA1C0|nr:ribosome-associated heat shock protein Hsp15 [Paraglaciecola sp. L3A3]
MRKNLIPEVKVRLDKWLWAARFFKTRSLARDAIQSGKVHYNGQRSKPGKIVELGAAIKVPQGFDIKDIIVLQVKEQRQGAPLAQLMYQETESSEKLRASNAEARKLSIFHSPKPEHRPDKKQRRQIIQFKQQ